MYLSDAEFEQVFGMTKTAFVNMASWKKPDLKKRAGLF